MVYVHIYINENINNVPDDRAGGVPMADDPL